MKSHHGRDQDAMEKKELALGDGMLEVGNSLIFADKQWHLQTGCATRGEPVDNSDRMKPNEEMVSFSQQGRRQHVRFVEQAQLSICDPFFISEAPISTKMPQELQ